MKPEFIDKYREISAITLGFAYSDQQIYLGLDKINELIWIDVWEPDLRISQVERIKSYLFKSMENDRIGFKYQSSGNRDKEKHWYTIKYSKDPFNPSEKYHKFNSGPCDSEMIAFMIAFMKYIEFKNKIS